MAVKGVDLSQWESGFSYSTLKSLGFTFAIIRAGYGQSTKDPLFDTHVNGCKAAGIDIPGVYWFIYAINETEALNNAKKCVEIVQAAGLPKSTRIWCDLEYDTRTKAAAKGVNLGKTEVTLFTKTFCEYVKSQGYPTGVYTNDDYYNSYYDKSIWNTYEMWLADPDGEADHPCMYHQYKLDSSVDGLSGKWDLDYYYGPQLTAETTTDKLTLSQAKQKLIDTAKSWIGYQEKASNANLDSKTANAGSANYTIFGKTMHSIYPDVMDFPAAWCDCFVDYCFYSAFGVDAAKAMLCGNFDDYTVTSAQYYKNKGRWYSLPEIGDQIFFKNSGGICHTGIVTAVDSSKVYTIEGNKSNMVKECSYALTDSYIAGYGRPYWDVVVGTTITTENTANTTTDNTTNNTTGGQIMFTFNEITTGAQGNDVKLLQRLLKSNGCKGADGKNLTIDGSFGANVTYALKAYQKKYGLTVDAICGKNTWKKILYR